MSDTNREFPSSFDLWDFVVAFENGSIPESAWNERTITVVAVWYLQLLPPSEVRARLETGLRRNHRRFSTRPGLLGDGLSAPNDLWPIVLRHVLAAYGDSDPLTVANWLIAPPHVWESQDRAA